MASQIQKIIKNSIEPKFIEDVFNFASQGYKDRLRASGENYIEHATRVALRLDQMGLDHKTIAAGLLHDVADISLPSAKKMELQEIEKNFGRDIADLVEKVSEISKIHYSVSRDLRSNKLASREKIENLRKMILAIAGDLRVVLIELASRIDNIERITELKPDLQKTYAIEILQIFVPLANRLGLGQIKRVLEDQAFANLFPEKYNWLKENIKEKYEEREKYLKKFIPRLKKILKGEKVSFVEINFRAKSYWSTFQKLQKYDNDFDRIHDLVAIRVITRDVASCYKALGVIHKYFKPISEEINDYIARPKPNGYKSLHTTVYLDPNRVSEIQIRTEEMHREAEFGVCAHWSYKEKVDLQKDGDKYGWTREVPEFWRTFKIDFFANQIFAFTPKGDVVALPKGSTPVDFAYAVHSDIGSHCESAKIAGKIIPLSQQLENGDVVEIITNKKRKPSQDWLSFVKTSFARSHIKKATVQNTPLSIFSIPSFLRRKISDISERAKLKREQKIQVKRELPRQIFLAGQKGMLVNIAKCCNPQPGDHVKAYLTKYRAAVLHKISCENFQQLSKKFPEKIIDASWK